MKQENRRRAKAKQALSIVGGALLGAACGVLICASAALVTKRTQHAGATSKSPASTIGAAQDSPVASTQSVRVSAPLSAPLSAPVRLASAAGEQDLAGHEGHRHEAEHITARKSEQGAAYDVTYDVAKVEKQDRARWADLHPREARQKAAPGSHLEVAHLVTASQWARMKPVHRSMARLMMLEARSGVVGVAPCFAPGTDPQVVQAFEGISGDLQYFREGAYWSSTATNPSRPRGVPMTLRWSIVPDGTPIAPRTQTGAITNSNLRARLNAIYGSEATWRPLFESIFARWSQLSGITYVYEPNDDGVSANSGSGQIISGNGQPGVIGVRGDVRIGGTAVDGASNVLAYNYFPNGGDMVIDTDDMTASGGFYFNTSNNSLGFRNVLSHEHGHGLGFAHVCPVNQTKLMEPFVSYNFDGPQIDDIQNAQKGYGDTLEENDTQSAPTDLGAVGTGSVTISRSTVSLDGSGDLDFYRFSIPASKRLTVTVSPQGGSYLEGPQNSDSTCTAGTTFNASAQRDLDVAILDGGGNVLTQGNTAAAGSPEVTSPTLLSPSAGPFSVRVSGDAVDQVQLYNVSLAFENAAPAPDFSLGGTVSVDDSGSNGNGDGKPDPGEAQVKLGISLRNIGDAAGTEVRGTLISLTPGVSVVQSGVSYPDIAAGATQANVARPIIAISSGFSCGTPISLRLDITSAQGTDSVAFSLSTGTLVPATRVIPYSGPLIPIQDGAVNSGTLQVSGVNAITDLDFSFDGTASSTAEGATTVGLDHTYISDVTVTLTSPQGTQVTIVQEAGGNNDGNNFYQTILDDEATSSIQNITPAGAPYSGRFKPASPLSAFDGQNPNGTWTLRTSDRFTGDTGNVRAFSLRIQTTEAVCGTPAAIPPVATSGVLISEFRLHGTTPSDEYVEIANATGAAINLSGWKLRYSTATNATANSEALPPGTTLRPRGRLLWKGDGYALPGGSSTSFGMAGNALDNSGVALLNGDGATVDAAGFASSPAAQREGSGILRAPTANGQYAFVRATPNASPQDSGTNTTSANGIGDNAADFLFVSTTGGGFAAESGGTITSMLGTPGPESVDDPILRNAQVQVLPLQDGRSATLSPNRTRTTAAQGGSAGTPATAAGTMLLRFRLRNTSTQPLSRIRFRITRLTTLGNTNGVSGAADMRLLSSSTESNVALFGGGSVPTVYGTTLLAPASASVGGGINAVARLDQSADVELSTPLAAGAELPYSIQLGVATTGNYSLSYNIEAISNNP